MPRNATHVKVAQVASAHTIGSRSRAYLSIENHASAILYVRFGGTAASDDHDICLGPESSGVAAKWEETVGWATWRPDRSP